MTPSDPARPAVRIRLYRDGDEWRADPMDMSGTPPNGRGRNQPEAIGSLILGMMTDRYWLAHGWPNFVVEGFLS